jgi:hypothetical protein
VGTCVYRHTIRIPPPPRGLLGSNFLPVSPPILTVVGSLLLPVEHSAPVLFRANLGSFLLVTLRLFLATPTLVILPS